MMFVSFSSSTFGAGTADLSGAPEFTCCFYWDSCCSICRFLCSVSRLLFVILSFFFWPLCCLSFFFWPLCCLSFFFWPLCCLSFFFWPLCCLSFFLCSLCCLSFYLRLLITILVSSILSCIGVIYGLATIVSFLLNIIHLWNI